MKPELTDLISTARRELRRASGLPPTSEELEHERIMEKTRNLEKFRYDTLRIAIMIPLRAKVTSHEGKVIAEFVVDESKFHLHPERHEFQLFVVRENQEKNLIRLERNDPQFTNRLLVAIGDEVNGGKPA